MIWDLTASSHKVQNHTEQHTKGIIWGFKVRLRLRWSVGTLLMLDKPLTLNHSRAWFCGHSYVKKNISIQEVFEPQRDCVPHSRNHSSIRSFPMHKRSSGRLWHAHGRALANRGPMAFCALGLDQNHYPE